MRLPPERLLAQAMSRHGIPLHRFPHWAAARGRAPSAGRILTKGEFDSHARIRGVLERESEACNAALGLIARGRWAAWNLPVRQREGVFHLDPRGSFFLADADPLTTPTASGLDVRLDTPWAFAADGAAFEHLAPGDRALQLTLQRAAADIGIFGASFRIERLELATYIDVFQVVKHPEGDIAHGFELLSRAFEMMGFVGESVRYEDTPGVTVRSAAHLIVKPVSERDYGDVGGPDSFIPVPEDSQFRFCIAVLPRPSLAQALNAGWETRGKGAKEDEQDG